MRRLGLAGATIGATALAGCGAGAGDPATAPRSPGTASADLAVFIEGPATQPAAEDAILAIEVRNLGPDAALQVTVTVDVQGDGVMIEPLDGGTSTEAGATWWRASLTAGASQTSRLRLRSPDVGQVTLRGSASSTVPDPVPGNSSTSDRELEFVTAVNVEIVSPRSGAHFYLGDAIGFEADVADHMGTPIAADIEWTSDVSGTIGTGERLERDDLPPGRHTIRAVAVGSADRDSAAVVADVSECGPFGDWSTSPYALPYPAGTEYVVNQANCSGFGHSGFWKHGYDFIMDIGTEVSAARSGTVGWANDGCSDGNTACTNLITVIHDDGTVALYSHLTNGGVLVSAGDEVTAGQVIGRSGNTGNTGGLPHLHFSLHPCNELPGLPNAGDCPTLPQNFRSTDPNPHGLQAGVSYAAD
ncbi:MAG: peptidoglycan DD-metalloendopeptidase family protein [Gemmatimonadota bacterium]